MSLSRCAVETRRSQEARRIRSQSLPLKVNKASDVLRRLDVASFVFPGWELIVECDERTEYC